VTAWTLGLRWLRAVLRPCGCQADVVVFGHTRCQLGPPPPTGEFRGGYSEPVR
jgi:hypothetical protein